MSTAQVVETLLAIGRNLRLARKRRHKSIEQAAAMMGVSVSSVRRMEAGDGGVKISTYLTALEVFQLLDTLRFAEPESDLIGLTLEKQRLPERIRQKKEQKLDF